MFDEKKFWAKGFRLDGCLIWPGAKSHNGYGLVKVNGKQHSAHRVAFMLTHGHWPSEARHMCKRRNCYEPSHIIEGTRSENMLDCRQHHQKLGKPAIVCGPIARMLFTMRRNKAWVADICGCSRFAVWKHLKEGKPELQHPTTSTPSTPSTQS